MNTSLLSIGGGILLVDRRTDRIMRLQQAEQQQLLPRSNEASKQDEARNSYVGTSYDVQQRGASDRVRHWSTHRPPFRRAHFYFCAVFSAFC